jgi:hypothetical protein
MAPYSATFLLPMIVDLGMNGGLTKRFHRLWRIVITSFLAIFFIFCTACFSSTGEEKSASSSYTYKDLFEVLDNLSSSPAVIMAHSNDGPSILYHTKHSVVGAPYHRQARGILFSHVIMEEPYNEEKAKRILEITDSAYIFVRKPKSPSPERPSLARMIATNDLPTWLSIVKLPEKFSDVVVAKIDRNKLNCRK